MEGITHKPRWRKRKEPKGTGYQVSANLRDIGITSRLSSDLEPQVTSNGWAEDMRRLHAEKRDTLRSTIEKLVNHPAIVDCLDDQEHKVF